MSKSIVTIGLCVKDGENTLHDAIASIISQDFPHDLIEVIFVDDGSIDSSVRLIERYTPEIDISCRILSHKWRGLGASRNVVLNHANGSLILWVDADMVLSKDYLKILVQFMEANPAVGIVKGKQSLESGANYIATLESWSRATGRMIDYNSKKAEVKSLGTGGSMHRIAALRQVGGFDENLTGYGEDFDVEYRIRKAGWLLSTTDVQFSDYERGQVTWQDLWKRYFKRGSDLYEFSKKHKKLIHLYNMLPPVAFFSGILYSLKLYRIIGHKIVLLLPIQCTFKMTASCFGFLKASFK